MLTGYRDLRADEATFRLDVQQDDEPVRGNVIDSGDDDFDREVEDGILARLDDGDEWAWAVVDMVATDPATGLEGHDYLGGCSYEDEEDFKRGGYWEDMRERALADLNAERRRMATALVGTVPA